MGEQEGKHSGQDVALVTCPRCNGTGKSKIHKWQSDEFMSCRYCYGKGEVEPLYRLSDLEQKVIDAIGEDAPLSTTCGRCEREIGIDEIIDTQSRWDVPEWKKLAQRIIKEVKEHED
jgi:transcription elongation factor Elf1